MTSIGFTSVLSESAYHSNKLTWTQLSLQDGLQNLRFEIDELLKALPENTNLPMLLRNTRDCLSDIIDVSKIDQEARHRLNTSLQAIDDSMNKDIPASFRCRVVAILDLMDIPMIY